MLIPSKTFHHPNLFETDLLLQLDPSDPLLKRSTVIPWHEFDEAFSIHYTEDTDAPSVCVRRDHLEKFNRPHYPQVILMRIADGIVYTTAETYRILASKWFVAGGILSSA